MGPGGITCCYPPWGFGKELPHMGTLWVPRARKVPIRARRTKEWSGPSRVAKPRGHYQFCRSLREKENEGVNKHLRDRVKNES